MNQSIRIKRFIALGLLVFVAFIIGFMVVNYLHTGWLLVSAPTKTPAGKAVKVEVVRTDGGDPLEFSLAQGTSKKIAMKRGIVRVNGSVGNLKSVDVLTIRGRKTSSVKTPLGEQRAIHKLGSDAQYCPVVAGGVTYSYNCNGSGPIYRHEKIVPDQLDPRAQLFDGDSFVYLRPFKAGLLGLPEGSGDEQPVALTYINLQTLTKSAVSLPADINKLLQGEQPDIIVNSALEQPYFLLVFRQKGAVYLFKDLNDTQPAHLPLPQNASLNSSSNLTSFAFTNSHIILYAGASGAENEGEVAKDTADPKQGNLNNSVVEYNLSGRPVKTIELSKGFSATGVDRINDSFYVAQRLNGVDFYYYKDGEMRQIYQLQDAATPLVVGSKVYVEAGGTIYAFKPGADGAFNMESVFSSPGVTVSVLFRNGNDVLFTGLSTRNNPARLDIYQLLGGQQTAPPVEDTLNLQAISDIISGYDYDDQTVVVALSHIYTPGITYDQLISNLQQILVQRGLSLGGRQVILYPFN